MRLVTVATHSERYYPYLKLSAERHGHHLVTLGWGEKWKGFSWRFQLMREYLATLPKDELICFIDGYDVLILETPSEIEHKFKLLTGGDTSKIVISCDSAKLENPFQNGLVKLEHAAVFTKCKGEYINAGTYMGTAGTLLKIYTDMCTEFKCDTKANDQVIIQNYCTIAPEQFILDSQSTIFLAMMNTVSELKINKDNISIKNTKLQYNGKAPSILHAPGNTTIDDIIEHLGYDTTVFKGREESKFSYILTMFFHYLVIFFKKHAIYIVIGILLYIYFFKQRTIKRFIKKL